MSASTTVPVSNSCEFCKKIHTSACWFDPSNTNAPKKCVHCNKKHDGVCRTLKCSLCSRRGHKRDTCTACTFCGKHGHIRQRCIGLFYLENDIGPLPDTYSIVNET